jgi:hypothetical protein
MNKNFKQLFLCTLFSAFSLSSSYAADVISEDEPTKGTAHKKAKSVKPSKQYARIMSCYKTSDPTKQGALIYTLLKSEDDWAMKATNNKGVSKIIANVPSVYYHDNYGNMFLTFTVKTTDGGFVHLYANPKLFLLDVQLNRDSYGYNTAGPETNYRCKFLNQ